MIKNHFDDCPYDCNVEGKILNPNNGKMIPCPHCSKIKAELLRKGVAVEETTEKEVKLSSLLGVKSQFLSDKFVYESLIPEDELVYLEEASVDMQRKDAEELYNELILGNKPANSLCFGISIKGRIDKFVYPMLVKAYIGGLSVAKCISCSEFSRMQLKMNDDIDSYIGSDIVVMVINEGCTNGDIACAKGLMQSRALRGNPTVFVSTWSVEACSALLVSKMSEDTMFMAKPSFVKYKSRAGKASGYINNILGEKNAYSQNEGRGVSISDL